SLTNMHTETLLNIGNTDVPWFIVFQLYGHQWQPVVGHINGWTLHQHAEPETAGNHATHCLKTGGSPGDIRFQTIGTKLGQLILTNSRNIQQHKGVIAKFFDSYTLSVRKTVRGRDQCVALPASDDLVTYAVDEVTGVGKYRIEPTLEHLLLQGFAVALGDLYVDLWVRHNKVFGNKRHPKRRHRGVAADVQGSDEFIGSIAHFLLQIRRATHTFPR